MVTLSEYRAEEKLRDGRTIIIRALHADDKELWKEVWQHMSPTSLYFRFFTPKRTYTEQEVKYFTELDFVNHVALIAIIPDDSDGTPTAVARYIRQACGKSAEVAVAVEDEFHGLGIGTLLLKHLAELAREQGIEEFTGAVLADNRKMLEVFENLGLPMKTEMKDYSYWEVHLLLGGSKS